MTEDNRIPEIRAALAAVDGDAAVPLEYLADTVRAVLREPPPAPQVFFPGDTVPAGTWVMNDSRTNTRSLVGNPERDWQVMFGPCVEVRGLPTSDEWQAAVDQAEADRTTSELRASEERAIPEPTEGQNRGE